MLSYNLSPWESEEGGLEMKAILDCIVTSSLYEPKSNKQLKRSQRQPFCGNQAQT